MLSNGFHDVPNGKVAMVVTHLEMTTPPPLRELALPDGITFRQVAPDLPWYRDIFDRVGAPWLWYRRRAFEDAELMAILNDPKVALYSLSRDGQDEALLELDFRNEGDCELGYFGLTPKLIGSGAGRWLMNKAIELAWAAPITRFHLQTCTNDSAPAMDFYIRSGFTPYRRQVEVDDDPRLNGISGEDNAPHVPLIR